MTFFFCCQNSPGLSRLGPLRVCCGYRRDLGNWRQSQHLKLVALLLQPYMNYFYFVAGSAHYPAEPFTVSMKGYTWSEAVLR